MTTLPRHTLLVLGPALAGALLTTPGAARADDGPDLGVAFQGWFHLGLRGSADFRSEGQPSIEDEEIENTIGFGLLGELRIAKFFGVGVNYQWFQRQHGDDGTDERWTGWDLDVHARLRVPLLILNVYARVPIGLSVITLPEDARVGFPETRGVGWNWGAIFGIELAPIPLLGIFVEVGPMFRNVPFDVDVPGADTVTIDVNTRDLTLNIGATLQF